MKRIITICVVSLAILVLASCDNSIVDNNSLGNNSSLEDNNSLEDNSSYESNSSPEGTAITAMNTMTSTDVYATASADTDDDNNQPVKKEDIEQL